MSLREGIGEISLILLKNMKKSKQYTKCREENNAGHLESIYLFY